MSSKNSTDLDLSKVETENSEELAKRIEGHYRSDSTTKSALSYHWERNHLYLDGKQWIVYDSQVGGTGGQWKTLQVSRANEYIPRPVTNYIYDIYQTLKSYLIQNQPRSTVIPNTQLYRDKQSAKIAELVVESNWERLKEEDNYEYAASCGITYGTVFKKDYWDTSSLMIAKVPKMVEQPKVDPATGQQIGTEQVEAVDPQTGEQLFDELPIGDVNTCVVEPYRIALDPLATTLHDCRWILEYSIQPLAWVREVYGKEAPGYTGLAEALEPEESLSGEMRRFYNLKTSSGTKNPGQPAVSGAQGTDSMIENAVVLKEYYERPSAANPRGRLIVVANSQTLYAGDSPYSGPELGDWHPYSEFRWEIVPGRFWGKSPLDDSTEIQKNVNSIDATIVLTRKTMAIPQKLIPTDSGIKPGEWTGRPGQEIRFRSTGQAPQTIPATGVDPQVFQERAQRVEDMKNISGAVDILKGDRPEGVTASSALELLFEVGTGKLRPSLNRWKRFIESSQKKQLKCVAKFYREPRPSFIQLLHSKNKELAPESISQFIGQDLYDNCNVRIEAGANVPKLQAAEKAQLLQMAQIGTLNLEDPENAMEFNHRLGVMGFDNKQTPDVKRAEWENDLLDNIGNSPDNKPVILVDDDHDVHKNIHTRRMKEPSFLSQPPEVIQAYQAHIMEHEQYSQMQRMQEQQEAMLTGQPPQPKQAAQNQLTPAGKGVSQDDASKAFGMPKGIVQ